MVKLLTTVLETCPSYVYVQHLLDIALKSVHTSEHAFFKVTSNAIHMIIGSTPRGWERWQERFPTFWI